MMLTLNIVLINELLASINTEDLVENEGFIKRIWTRAKELGVISNNSEGRRLLEEGDYKSQSKRELIKVNFA